VQKLFAKYGTIVNFEWISKEGSKMALIEMSTLKEAVLSLIVSFFFCFLIIFEYKKRGFIEQISLPSQYIKKIRDFRDFEGVSFKK